MRQSDLTASHGPEVSNHHELSRDVRARWCVLAGDTWIAVIGQPAAPVPGKQPPRTITKSECPIGYAGWEDRGSQALLQVPGGFPKSPLACLREEVRR